MPPMIPAVLDTPDPTGSNTPAGTWVDGAWAQNGLPVIVIVEEFHHTYADETLVAAMAELARSGRKRGVA